MTMISKSYSKNENIVDKLSVNKKKKKWQGDEVI